MQLAFVLVILFLAMYGAHNVWLFLSANPKRLLGGVAVAGLTLVAIVPDQATFAQSGLSVAIDLQPFFDSLNTFLPVAIGLFATVGGIIGALGLARMIIGLVVRSFSSGTL